LLLGIAKTQQIRAKEVKMDSLKFKGFCATNNIKQLEIAELLGISVANVNEKINGKQSWTLGQVKILCEHYKISADEYFI